MKPGWTYKAQVARVVDADTFELDVDLGFGVRVTIIGRVRGVDAPEASTVKGSVSKQAMEFLLADQVVVIRSYKARPYAGVTNADKRDRYGRWLVDIETEQGVDIAGYMLDAGLARKWTKRR